MRTAILVILGVLALLVGACSNDSAEEITTASSATSLVPTTLIEPSPSSQSEPPKCDPNRSAPTGMELWRWGDVTVFIPADGSLRAIGKPPLDPKTEVYELYIEPKAHPDHGIVIDPISGVVRQIADDVQPDNEVAVQDVVKTIEVCPLDPAAAPWPYSGDPPSGATKTLLGLEYIEPDPASGIQVGGGTLCSDGCLDFLAVESALSVAYVAPEDGRLITPPGVPAHIVPEEQPAFDRFLSSVRVVKQ